MAGRASDIKIPRGVWLDYSRSRLCGCCRPADASERRPAINQRPHQIQNWMHIKKVWVLVLGFFTFLSAVFAGFSLVLDPRVRLGDLRGKDWTACKKFQDNENGKVVNVSDSSGASSAGVIPDKGLLRPLSGPLSFIRPFILLLL